MFAKNIIAINETATGDYKSTNHTFNRSYPRKAHVIQGEHILRNRCTATLRKKKFYATFIRLCLHVIIYRTHTFCCDKMQMCFEAPTEIQGFARLWSVRVSLRLRSNFMTHITSVVKMQRRRPCAKRDDAFRR
jgi:hypothetical protein